MANARKDLTGQKFSRLTVLRYVGVSSSRVSRWECLCDCGAISIVGSDNLKRGITKSCGCLLKEKSKERIINQNQQKQLDLSGSTSGLLSYGSEVASKNTNRRILARCGCGKKVELEAAAYISGRQKSCGCLNVVLAKERIIRLNQSGNLPRSAIFKDLTGEKFHYLTVLEEAPRSARGLVQWHVICECGSKRVVPTSKLKSGHTKSCGCKSREMARLTQERKQK